MKRFLRGVWACAVVGATLSACGSSNNNSGNGGAMDAGARSDTGATADRGATGDRPSTLTDRPGTSTDRPAPQSACAAPRDLSNEMRDAMGIIRVMGSNDGAALDTVGALPAACLPSNGTKGAVVAFRYTMRAAGTLRASTNNEGTNFDTIVAVLPTCTTTAVPVACNDDAADAPADSEREYSSTAVSTPLMAGQTVFIVVGGWGKEFETAETGDFVLTVQEVAAGGM